MHFKVCSAYIFYRTFLETTLSVLKCTVFAVEGIQSIRYTTIRNALRISCATRSNFTVGHSIPIVAINYRHSWTVSLGTVVMIIVGRCSINFG